MDRDHMVVGDRRSRPGLAGKTQPGRAEVRQLGDEDLDRDDAGEGRIRAFQDHAHPSSADDLEDLIRTEGTDGRESAGGSRKARIASHPFHISARCVGRASPSGFRPAPGALENRARRPGKNAGHAIRRRRRPARRAHSALFTAIEMGGQQFLLSSPSRPSTCRLSRSVSHSHARLLIRTPPSPGHSPSTCSITCLIRATTRLLAMYTAPTLIPRASATTCAFLPSTPVSQKAAQVVPETRHGPFQRPTGRVDACIRFRKARSLRGTEKAGLRGATGFPPSPCPADAGAGS